MSDKYRKKLATPLLTRLVKQIGDDNQFLLDLGKSLAGYTVNNLDAQKTAAAMKRLAADTRSIYHGKFKQ